MYSSLYRTPRSTFHHEPFRNLPGQEVSFVMLSTDVRTETADLARPLRSGFHSGAEASDIDDWSIARTERVNALLVGPATLTEDVIAREFPFLLLPAAVWSASQGLDVSAGLASVLVRNVQDLTSDQQDRLMSWMDRHRAIQIVSTATCPLYPCVVAGQFRTALYYRLNTLYFAL